MRSGSISILVMAARVPEGPGLEETHVHQVYSQIAQHFSDTRYKPWPRVAQFLQQLPPASLVADVGCGNGKYFPVCSHCHSYMIGCDLCPELVRIAGVRGHQVLVGNCLRLPLRSGQFDAAISVAVVHHMSSLSRRLQALQELVRVLRVGGRALVYVWALEQKKRKFSAQDVLVPWHLQPKYSTAEEKKRGMMEVSEEAFRTVTVQSAADPCQLSGQSSTIPPAVPTGQPAWPSPVQAVVPVNLQEQGYQTFLRYYHVFRDGELGSLMRSVDGVRVLEEFYDHENWCVVVEKMAQQD